jgi:hypothetical protein
MTTTTPPEPLVEPGIYDVICPKCHEQNFCYAGQRPIINVVREEHWNGVRYICNTCSFDASIEEATTGQMKVGRR